MKIAAKSAITPPSLLGTDRRMAYNHRKYHSGWICVGVISIFASVKFSGSINIFGASVDIVINNIIASINPMVSLIVKYR